MFGRIFGTTLNVMLRTPAVLALAAISVVDVIAVTAIFQGFWMNVLVAAIGGEVGPATTALALVASVAQQMVILGITGGLAVAIVRVVLGRLQDKDVSLRAALAFVYERRFREVLAYAVLLIAVNTGISLVVGLAAYGTFPLAVANVGVSTGAPFAALGALPTDDGGRLLIGLALGFVTLIWLAANALAYPVIAVEGATGVDAVRRSWTIVRRSVPVLAAYAVACAVLFYGILIVAVPGTLSSAQTALNPTFYALQQHSLALLIATMLITVFSAVFTAVWYHEAKYPAGAERTADAVAVQS